MLKKLMKINCLWVISVVFLTVCVQQAVAGQNIPADNKTVRVCIIGGTEMVGLWSEISEKFETKTGYKVVVIKAGSRTIISKPFRKGEADVLTMHSGDITTNLVADGYGINMRPWSRNDLVIVGPPSDPVGIRGMKSGAAALKRIAEKQASFVDNRANGPRELGHTLWRLAGLDPIGDWVIKDESKSSLQKLTFAESKSAYMIFGRMPITYHKVPVGSMQIMVEEDPIMRRPYIVMEANPQVFPHTNSKGAQALSDFLLSEEIQTFLLTYGLDDNAGKPVFYPVWPYGERVNE